MGIKRQVRRFLSSISRRYGYEIVKRRMLYDWQITLRPPLEYRESHLPEGARSYLVPTNPRLRELHARYAGFNRNVTTPLVWHNEHVSPDDMLYFRGDNAYVWQFGHTNFSDVGYALATYYIRTIDEFGLLESLPEDDFFGAHTYSIGGRTVSRDLLDSIVEIYFLEKHLKISAARRMAVLDIGAGYGRLAHRMVQAIPGITEYLCTDAVPVSTFISEYYLRFRKLGENVSVIPLDEVERALARRPVDCALNIHSFSECRLEAIDWWMSLLERHRVRYLMIVPNGTRGLRTDNGLDFRDIVERHGYALRVSEPKYRDPVVQRYAMEPVHHFLFELGRKG